MSQPSCVGITIACMVVSPFHLSLLCPLKYRAHVVGQFFVDDVLNVVFDVCICDKKIQ